MSVIPPYFSIIIVYTISFASGAVARLFQSLKKDAREEDPQLKEKITVEARRRRQGARRRRVSTNSLFTIMIPLLLDILFCLCACSCTSVEVSLFRVRVRE